jgi:CheY-like chemotaxis protein
MIKGIRCIMLVDDNEHDNFFHEREIKKVDASIDVVAKQSGNEALDYLKLNREKENLHPDLIFLDINMQGMNGWEFLEQYSLLTKEVQSHALIVMLTTSSNPADNKRAQSFDFISDYITKPLTQEIMIKISTKYFK